jgi:rfaE bifunctional protein kinase chain/domain
LEIKRASPEANVPVVCVKNEFSELGGAGNALRHLSNLSKGSHELVTVVGGDSIGEKIDFLLQSGSFVAHLIVDPNRKSTLKERVHLEEQQIFRLDVEDSNELSTEVEFKLFAQIKKSLPGKNAILISDYAKGVLTKRLVSKVILLAKDLGIPIVSDPGLGRIALHAGCDIIKPNNKEWSLFVSEMGSEEKGVLFLFSKGTKFIVITHGDRGIRIIGKGMDVFGGAEKVGVLTDVTGAGDSVAAILSLLVDSTGLVSDYLPVLNRIGAKTVSELRTALPAIGDLKKIDGLQSAYEGRNE